jgi:hypothetical protein
MRKRYVEYGRALALSVRHVAGGSEAGWQTFISGADAPAGPPVVDTSSPGARGVGAWVTDEERRAARNKRKSLARKGR